MSLDTTTAPQEQATDEEAAETGAAPVAEKAADAATAPAEEDAKPKRGRPKGAAARKTRTVELTLTVTGSADGDWQAELKHGSTWVARGLAISAAAVSRAAKELHGDLSTPIDEVINEAREQQKAKVAQLEAELEQAKQALAELDA
ncbi:DUF6319 family protein [Amycolatopsis acidiphila]|uniref:Mucin n=1 Tax=Amycolatopsis acidiphila TaxID=715473 RepID=A0A557ZQU1_9PSEU|nr:DUF6319 family protein [Amycolatopsis acidiphila]TVT14393.1 hypothetical protein FNH06_37775 [Amycolatopsis acidiphila]UIJ59487.1 DUF6319 family protein [Amycolatopsis acidiphila]GHG80182.1 hypothetical protein GCM10017788_48960 [Amycolatopsis acidiphila]